MTGPLGKASIARDQIIQEGMGTHSDPPIAEPFLAA